MKSQEGDEFCIMNKPRFYSSGENLITRQTAREKRGKEKELTYGRNLRKRRSFLKTDYTSQVTFPVTLPGSLQSCCSWPPPAPLLAQLPTPPSSESLKKDAELGGSAATQTQRGAAGTTPCSHPMEMEPDTMETKSVTSSVVSCISAVRLQGGLCREESAGIATHVDSGLQPASAVQLPCISLEEDAPFPEEQSRAAQEGSTTKTSTGWLPEERCVATGDELAQAALEVVGEVTAAHQKAGAVPPFLGQDATCPANEHTHLPSAPGPSKASPHEVAQDQNSAGRQAVCEDPVPDHCEERKANCDGYAEDSRGSAQSQTKSRQVVNKAALQEVHSKNHVGFPDAAQLLADCSCTSGVITRVSWLSFGVRTDFPPPSSSQERAGILSSQQTSERLGAGATRREMQTSPPGPSLEKELISSQGLDEGESRKNTGNVAYEQPGPVQLPLPSEQATEMGKDTPLTPSPRLSVSSGPIPLSSLERIAGDHGASTHSFLCFNHKKDEQTPSDAITTRPMGFSTVKTSPPQLGMDMCGCRLPYINCFHRPDDRGEHKTTVPVCNTFLEPLTTPPSSSCSLPGTPVSSYPISITRHMAWQDPHVQALSQLQDQARVSPADFSCFLAYTTELQEVVRKLSGNQATHLQDQCAEQATENKDALGLASRDLLCSCQELLKVEQSLKMQQEVLRVTFVHLVQLAGACFQVTHCQLCRQRQPELHAALMDVVSTYHHLVQAVHQQLCRQGCPDLGAKLLTRQHTALTAAVFCLLQQLRAPPL